MTELLKLGGKTFIFEFETTKVFSKYDSTNETTTYRVLYQSGLEEEIVLDNKVVPETIGSKVTILKLGDKSIIIAPIFDNYKNKFSLFFRGSAIYEVVIIDHISKNYYYINNLEKIYKELCELSSTLGILNPIFAILLAILGSFLSFQYYRSIGFAIAGFVIGFVSYWLLIWLIDNLYSLMMKSKIHILRTHISKLTKDFY